MAAPQAPLASSTTASRDPRRPAPRPSSRLTYVPCRPASRRRPRIFPACRQRRKQEMLAVRKKVREAVTGFLPLCIERRDRYRRAARGGDLEEWTTGVWRIDDDAIWAPGATASARRVRERFGAPPVTAIVFSFNGVKKPMRRLSGDQNGNWPPSPPSSRRTAIESSDRTHNSVSVCEAEPVKKATIVPSGEIARLAESGKRLTPCGPSTERRLTRASTTDGFGLHASAAIAVAAAISATAGHSHPGTPLRAPRRQTVARWSVRRSRRARAWRRRWR